MAAILNFLFLLPLFFIPTRYAAPHTASFSSQQQKLDVRSYLSRFNKPPVKSIKSPDGDIIDCVRISHQPAFDHPLLKNRTIQMRPSFYPEGVLKESKVSSKPNKGSKPVSQLWHLKGRCPRGTIPIRRIKEDDILRASSVESYGKKQHPPTKPKPRSARPQPDLIRQSGHQHAIVYVEGDKYYGAKATINVWAPKIQEPNEFSLSQIWILGGTFGQDLNSIEAGWQVSPDLYGDNRTRLFTYWTSDAYQATGCYNLLCTGFIQTNNEIAMGATIYPVSGYGGSQYDISLLVWKDPNEGNWWIQFGNEYVLGYWPAFLFSYLVDSATMIEWGGEVVNSETDGEHTRQMENTPVLRWEAGTSLKKVLERPVTSGIFKSWMDPINSGIQKALARLLSNPAAMMPKRGIVVSGAPIFTMVVLVETPVARDTSYNQPPLTREQV